MDGYPYATLWGNAYRLQRSAITGKYTGRLPAMKPPRIPPMLASIVQTGLLAIDGASFTELAACPACGGPVSGYDTKQKVFALVRDGEDKHTLRVSVKRFSCRTCGRIVNAEEPFYPGTRIGSPVIDLCLTLAATMPANRTAAYLDAMGVLVDRTSCRLYIRDHARPVPASDLFGIMVPLSVVSLSTLAGQKGKRTPVSGAEILAACGFPSSKAGSPHTESSGT